MKRFKWFITEAVIDDVKKKFAFSAHNSKDSLDMLSHAAMDSNMLIHVHNHYPKIWRSKASIHRIQNKILNGEISKDVDYHESLDTLPTHHIINKLAEGDPSKDKKHLPMIAHWYSKGQFRSEDLGSSESHSHSPNWNTVHGTLKAFSDIKNKDLLPDLEHPDTHKAAAGQKLKGTRISSYAHMTWPQFRSHVHKHLGLDKASGGNIEEHPDALFLGEHHGTKLYHLQSQGAAKHANKCFGAKWCTGWEGDDNMFSHYDRNGPIYLAHHKDGTVHQLHLESKQFMDKEDAPVEPRDLADKHPGLTKFPQLQEYHVGGGHLPFMPHEKLKSYAHSQLQKLKTMKSDNGVDTKKPAIIVARHGSHEDLKEFDKHAPFNHSAHALAHARRWTEFDEDPMPEKHKDAKPGTESHLAGLFHNYNHAKKLFKNLPEGSGVSDVLSMKMSSYDRDFQYHYGSKTRQDIYGAVGSARTHHLKNHPNATAVITGNAEPNHEELAKAYMHYKELPTSDKRSASRK